MVARGLKSGTHAILAQIVPIRRCNLACRRSSAMSASPISSAIARFFAISVTSNHASSRRSAIIQVQEWQRRRPSSKDTNILAD